MLDVESQDTNELVATDDQQLVAFPADRPYPALGDGIRVERPHGRADHLGLTRSSPGDRRGALTAGRTARLAACCGGWRSRAEDLAEFGGRYRVLLPLTFQPDFVISDDARLRRSLDLSDGAVVPDSVEQVRTGAVASAASES
jgi:hypothetical protein